MKPLDHHTYDQLLKLAKYQFLVITETDQIYYRNPQSPSHDGDFSCLVIEEQSGEPEIVDYNQIKKIVVDGHHFEFAQIPPTKLQRLLRKLHLI